MFHRLLLCAGLVAAALTLPGLAAARATASKLAAKAAQADAALSEGLAEPAAAGLDALQSLQDVAKKAKSTTRTAPLVRKAEALKGALQAAVGEAREAKPDKDEAAARDAVVVALAQGLRAAELVSQGLQDQDDGHTDTGAKLAGLALADLQRLQTQGPEAVGAAHVGGGGGGGGPIAIGPSVGADMSYSGQEGSSALSAGLTGSVPLSKAVDLGAGLNTTLNTSTTSGGGSNDSGGLGLSAFVRYNFLSLFDNAPWIVPYLGGKLGYNLNSSWGYNGGTSFTSSDSTSVVVGYQLGVLFFVSQKMAITTQLELDQNGSASDNGGSSTSSTSTSSMALTMGFRQMF